jgi:hypothetical protein
MTSPDDRYWFPAKRYGWGWGVPRCWQGWAVLVGYLVLGVLGVRIFQLPRHALLFALYQAVITGALIIICWQKGEPPRWRWGEDE